MRFKELRILNKKSQNEIAKILNIAQKSYSNYELGATEPNISNLIKLADYYYVTIDYLVDRPYSNTFGYLSNDEKDIIQNYRQMSNENQSKLIAEKK